jgi:hypothetical protein
VRSSVGETFTLRMAGWLIAVPDGSMLGLAGCWIWRAGVCGLAVGDGEEVGRCVAAGLLSVCWFVVGVPLCEAIVLAFVACKLCWTAQAPGFTLLDRQSHGDDEQKTGHFW